MTTTDSSEVRELRAGDRVQITYCGQDHGTGTLIENDWEPYAWRRDPHVWKIQLDGADEDARPVSYHEHWLTHTADQAAVAA